MEDACIFFFSVGESARTSVDCKQRQGSVERTKEEKLKGDSEALRDIWNRDGRMLLCSVHGQEWVEKVLLFVKHVVLTVVTLFNLVSLSFSPSSFHLLLPPLSFTDATKKLPVCHSRLCP